MKKALHLCTIFFVALILALQPVYAATLIGEFGAVDSFSEQSRINQSDAERASVPSGGSNSVSGGLIGLPEVVRAEVNLLEQEGINITVIQQNLTDSTFMLSVGAVAPIEQQDSSQQNITQQISLSDWKFAKEIGSESESWEPKRVTSVFSKEDYISYLWVKYVDIYEAHSGKWKWYDPKNSYYADCTFNLDAPPSGYYWLWFKTWCGVYIKGMYPASNPGIWNAEFYLESSKAIDADFFIKYVFKESKMVRGVDGDGNPGTETYSFSASDDAAYTWARLNNVADPLNIEWKWYAPDSSLYKTFTHTTQNPGTDKSWDGYNLWSSINIKDNPPENLCGDWQVKTYIDGQFVYSRNFVIENCVPPPKCDANALESWVSKDGEIYNNIKTHHKFENTWGETLDYNINFELFDPNGAKVASTSNNGQLGAGWVSTWWVQYGVPSGGWKPGSYVSRATVNGYCSTQQVTLSNQAYPNIPAPVFSPGIPETNYCDGNIKVKVSDKYSNNLQSVKIYLDGSIEGTTSADGGREIIIADDSCGQTHAVKAVCPDDSLCSVKSSTISYDGDVNSVFFICDCPGTIPGLDIEATTDSYRYVTGSQVKMNVNIKDAAGNFLRNALLTIYDPFLGATKFFNPGEGLLSYSSEATLTGLQAFFLSSYKQGFLPGLSKVKVVVEDFTGRISVQATHKDGSALSSALIFLDDEFKGVTDSSGRKVISGDKGRTSVLALKCAGATVETPYCSGTPVTIADNNFVSLSCDCGPEGMQKEGTVLLQVRTKPENCYSNFRNCPIGNALVIVDNSAMGYTPLHGFIELQNLKYGKHKVSVRGFLSDDEDDTTPELKEYETELMVSEPFGQETFELSNNDFVALSESSLEAQSNVSEQFIIIPILIWVAFTAWDAKTLNDCEKKYDYDPIVAERECMDERLWLGSNFIPLGTVFNKAGKGIKGLVHLLEFVDGKWVRKAVEVTRVGEVFTGAIRLYDRIHNIYQVTSEYGSKALGYVIRKTGLDEIIIIINHVESVILRDWDAAVKAVQLKFLAKDTLQVGDTVLKGADFAHLPFEAMVGAIKGELGEAYAEEAFKQLAKRVDPNIAVKMVDEASLGLTKDFKTTNYRFIFKPNKKSIEIFTHDKDKIYGEIDRLFDFQGKPVIVEAKLTSKIIYPGTINPKALPEIMKATQELYVEKILKNELPELTTAELQRTITPQYVVAGPSDVMKTFVHDPVNPVLPSASWHSLTEDLIKQGYENPLPLSLAEDYAALNKMANDLARGVGGN